MTEYTLLALAIVVIFFISRGARIVPQGYEFTIERFGRYTHTLTPGFHLIIPLIDRVGAKVNMMESVMDVPTQDVITKDNAAVAVDGIVFYQVLDAAKSAYEVARLEHAILNLTMTNIRTVMGSMDLDELLSNREVINARLLQVIDEATHSWGTKVTRVEIKDIRPPRDLIDSMARQMKAEREKRAMILEAEGERQSAILAAEGDRQAKILKAEGLKQSMILEAEARKESAQRDAEARERLAQAEAFATAEVSRAVKEGSTQAINYFVAQKYVEAFKALAESNNQKLVLMPMETSSLVGTISGIAEIVKDSIGSQSETKRSTKGKSE
ncbi:SPFH domain-containing protein [Candidatus Odyssella acanthamoebae]|uniref:Protein QmcA n=1 Tax=Candidatus Odyssella acanthamoebae TaxID=91604 RepID=A0A077AUR9_9PROT|nr:SPFH domain-containing protein [Candidatus Paracaedibacter acanthamoebae]AIK95774.1 membrane protein [Candidatus Paracaedibacter acanthamoebae]